MKIFLSFTKFRWNHIESYLSLGIRLVIYFKGRGQYFRTKLHHCGATDGRSVWEAKITFKKHPAEAAFRKYDKVIILEPTFKFDEVIFKRVIEDDLGKFYNFWGIICQLIFQTTGCKIQKSFRLPYCSSNLARAFYFSCDEHVKHFFSDYHYIDPQDFVRMWQKSGLFKQVLDE